MASPPVTRCISLYGQEKWVPTEKLVFRASAYGLVVSRDKILLVNTRHLDKWSLPGGGVEIGETLRETLKREVREETGVEIEVEEQVHFQEQFFYYDPLDEAFHSFCLFIGS